MFPEIGSRSKFILAGLLLGVAAGGSMLAIRADSKAQDALGPSAVPEVFVEPARIRIPSLEVDARVVPVGLAQDGTMDTASDPSDVAWYRYGPVPGMPGSAVMAGHLDTAADPRAVFYNLNKLQPGDRVETVDANGKMAAFRVTGKKLLPYHNPAPEVFASGSASRLTLVTCAGTWDRVKKVYSHRLAVFAERT